MEIRHDWARDEIRHLYHLPVPDLIFQAQLAHRAFHKADEIQICRLLSIKTGGCPEDCAYCSQSAHYETGVVREGLMNPVAVREAAKCAKNEGATRFCMGAAWSRVSDGENFDRVLDMVRAVAALDMEVCCTLGMLTESSAATARTMSSTRSKFSPSETRLHAAPIQKHVAPSFFAHLAASRTATGFISPSRTTPVS